MLYHEPAALGHQKSVCSLRTRPGPPAEALPARLAAPEALNQERGERQKAPPGLDEGEVREKGHGACRYCRNGTRHARRLCRFFPEGSTETVIISESSREPPPGMVIAQNDMTHCN